ncbi:MAG: hypothetical protein PHU14_03215 [Methylovulum sp.]|nr:hypothetical protein [Methylovulum sp.]
MAVTDDSAGHIVDKDGSTVGTINYSTGVVSFTAVETYSYLKTDGQVFFAGVVRHLPNQQHVETTSQLLGGTSFNCQYSLDTASTAAKIESVSLTQIRVDLSPATAEDLVAGSLRFIYAGTVFIDRNGTLYRNQNRLNDAAIAAGTIDYQTGLATLTSWTGGSTSLTIKSAVTVKGSTLVMEMYGRTPGAPLATGQFQVTAVAFDGVEIIASADNNGNINDPLVQGHVNWLTGAWWLSFGQQVLDSSLSSDAKASGWYDAANVVNGYIWAPLPIKAETAKFNAVLLSYLPLDASILGINTVRLPSDGRVPIFRQGNMAIIHNTQTYTLPNPAVASHTYDMGRTRLAYARLYDKNGLIIPASNYTADLNAGTVTIAPSPVFTGFVQPFYIEHRVEDMRLITDVQISGQITLQRTLTHDYPANTSFISSALLIGDMQARVNVAFEQTAWTAAWADTRSGTAPLAQFNSLLFPIIVTNQGAIMERWVVVFTSPTAFSCYGESYGLIAIGTANEDFSPINPLTQQAYFTISAAAWGLGWSTGNCFRFNTISANFPLWIARCTNQSEAVAFTDQFKIQVRGDSN